MLDDVLDGVERGTPPTTSVRRSRAAALFADISGFTPISEALGRSGPHGAEELTDILNDYFDLMVGIVEAHGGVVCSFGGDAMTVVFPMHGRRSTAPGRALACALAMQAVMPRWASIPTSAGPFGLAMKAGVAAGGVVTFSVGDPETRLEHVVAGGAIESCVAAEHEATAGCVVGHDSVLQLVSDVELRGRRGAFAQVVTAPSVRKRLPARSALPSSAEGTIRAYLHPVIAERVVAGHEAYAYEHRRLSVVFVGLDGLDFEADPDAPRRLQRFGKDATEVIRDFDGHLRQVETGDKGCKLLVLFGAPVSHEDDDERALRCALGLRELGEPPVRIGISAGRAFCGVVGSQRRREYAAVGDTVNIAARLMHHATPGEILATGQADTALRGFELRSVSRFTVKGKADSIETRAVDRWRGRGRARRAGPFVGRRPELECGRSLVESAGRGDGRVLLVTGEPGIGKTQLCEAVLDHARTAGFEVVTGSCDAVGIGVSYLPWQPIVRHLLGLGVTTEVVGLEAVERGLRRLDPALVPRATLLGPAIRATLPDDPRLRALDPELRAELLRSLLVSIVARRASVGTLALGIEDGHWLDEASAHVLADMARIAAGRSLLLVVSSRPVEAAWLAEARPLAHAAELRLGRFPERELDALLASYGVVPESDSGRILAERAEGNPLFLAELVSLVRGSGIDIHDSRALARLSLPTSLSSLALARIDQLGEHEKMTLKAASVAGQTFSSTWVAGGFVELGGHRSVTERLLGTERAELVDRLAADEYAFRHVTIRDAAYESLSVALRRDLHERLGQYVERAHADALDQYVDTLAHHFSESHNVPKQIIYLRRAGDAAARAFSNAAAVDYYERLLAHVSGAERIEVLLLLGGVLQHVGDWPRADTLFREALERAPDKRLAAEARRALGTLLGRAASFHEARLLLEQALAVFDEVGEDASSVRCLEALAHLAWQRSDHEQSLRLSAEQLRRAEALGDHVSAATAVEQRGLVHWHRGERDDARRAFDDALSRAREAGDVRLEIHARNDLAGLEWELGSFSAAITHVSAALELCAAVGYRHAAIVLTGNAAELLREQGEHARALTLAEQTMEAALELGDWVGVLNQIGNAARTVAAMGDTDAAGSLFESAESLGRALDHPYHLSEYLHHDAVRLADLGRLRDASAKNREALELARDIGRGDLVAEAEPLQVLIRHRLGEVPEAQAIAELERLGSGDDEASLAACFYAWTVDRAADRQALAGEGYARLHERTPKWIYRERHAALSADGSRLPAPPSLPHLPGEGPSAVGSERIVARARGLATSAPTG